MPKLRKPTNETLRDLPSLRGKLERIDNNRLSRIKEARDTRNFKVMIQNWSASKLRPKILSDKQRMAIHLMTDFVHNFSYDWIAARLGVHLDTIYNWRNDPLFLRELDKEITRRRSFIRLHAFRNVHRAVIRGDMKATWNYLKMSGDLKENIEVIDRTGEHELSDNELNQEIVKLTQQLANAHEPSTS